MFGKKKFAPKVCFISYRSDQYERALELAQLLSRGIPECTVLEPGRLCLPEEVRTAQGFFELIAALEEPIGRAEAFVALNTAEYRNSYWTRMEVDLWCRKEDRFAAFNVDAEGSLAYEGIIENRHMWWFHRVMLNDTIRTVRDERFHGLISPYGSECLIVPCAGCEAHLLVTRAYAREHGGAGIRCESCGTAAVLMAEGDRFVVPSGLSAARPMHPDTLMSLMTGGRAIKAERNGVRVKLNGERLALFALPGELEG